MTVKTTRRRRTALVVAAVVGLVGLTACDSQPSAKRVAEDLVESLSGGDLAVEECMFEKLDAYSRDELNDIGNDISSDNADLRADAQQKLDQLEAELATCR